ncbi:hypothetical protein [Thermococcus sp. JCM 11816]|uniref:hypothetical protein n=1 Tax=Thermococcus sp. (strain JCM 11816 / KS-1) TaxID=1295125 RepID=UPI000B30FDA9
MEDIVQKLKSGGELVSNIKGPFALSSQSRERERVEAWTARVNPRKGVEGVWRIYPLGKIKPERFRKLDG